MSFTVNGKTYDADKWMPHHPGGATFIKAFSGTDATEAFYTYHRKPFPHQKMNEFAVSSSEQITTNKDQISDKRYQHFLELSAMVNKVIPNQGFAPKLYYLKIFGLMVLTISIECNMLYHGKDYVLSVLLGVCYAWIGLNIQHDSNHGAVSRNPTVNYLLGLSQCYIGGDNLKWIKQHVVEHHVFANHYNKDPDIDGAEILRFHEKASKWVFHVVQCIYVWILLSIYGFIACFAPSKISTNPINVGMKVFFVLRVLVAPFLIHYDESMDISKEILCIFLFFLCGGFYLGFFFIISHNFVQSKHFNDDDLVNVSLLQRQVEASSNVGGPVLCFFNGGLNYQIEHHLFPRVNHCYYPQIAPLVQAYCKSKNIQYTHFPTIYDNFKSSVQYFYSLGI